MINTTTIITHSPSSLTSNSTNTTTTTNTTITTINNNNNILCCIVDDHCDIIPFLFSCYKAKKINIKSLLYLHIDSHPDFIPPLTNINNYKNINMLYDLLDNENGISEFILPLIINNHIEKIIWLHQKWCKQFNDGNNSFIIGNNIYNNLASVTLQESYYFDEGIVYDINELELTKNVEFFTCTNDNFDNILQDTLLYDNTSFESNIINQQSNSWILDICLDYFTVSNPFYLDLEQQLKEFTEISIHDIIQPIQEMFTGLKFRSNNLSNNNALTLLERRNERLLFLSLTSEILNSPIFPSLESICCIQFINLFELNKQYLAERFLQKMSTLSLTIRKFIFEADITMIATLPHNPVDWNDIQVSIQQLEIILQTCIQQFHNYPQVICIARSDGDRYTNPELVDQIQEGVLNMLNKIFENQIDVYDIREDCHIKCHQLFRVKGNIISFSFSHFYYLDSNNISSRKRKLLEESGYKL